MKKFFKRLLTGKYNNKSVLFIFLFLGLAINFPYLTSPFYYDDFFFVSLIEKNLPYNEFVGFWAVNLEEVKSFESIWWRDAGTNVQFLRPVPSYIISSSLKLLGRDAVLPLHLFSIILHSCVAFTVLLLFNRLSKRYPVSITAGFLFLICVHHSGTIAWISAMTDIIAVLFMNLCLYYYIKQKESPRWFYIFLSNLFLILALLSKETAVIAPIAVILYELSVSYSSNFLFRENLKAFFRSWKQWGTSFLILISFLVLYKLGEFGTSNAMYYNPLSEPLTYFANLFTGFPVLMTGYLSVFPITFVIFMPELMSVTVIFGYMLFVILVIVLIPYRKDRIIWFCFLLLIAAVLPQLSTDASERQLYYPYVAGSFIISFIIFQLKFLKKEFSPDTPKRVKIIGSSFGYYLFGSSLILSFILSFYYPYSFKSTLDSPEKFILKSKKIADTGDYLKIIFLNTSGPFNALYAHDIFRYYNGEYKDLHILSSFNGKVWINKISDSSFVLKTDSKGWLSNMFAKVLRKNAAVEQGRIYSYPDFNTVILKTTDDMSDVLEVRFDFKFNLTASLILLLYYDGIEIKEWNFALQKKVEWILIGDTSDVLKSFF